MARTSTASDCTCAYDCNANRYTFSVSSSLMNVERICSSGSEKNFYSDETFFPPSLFVRNYQTLVEGRSMGTKDVCMETLKNMAVLKFQLEGQSITRIKRSIRVTLADHVSNFGAFVQRLFP